MLLALADAYHFELMFLSIYLETVLFFHPWGYKTTRESDVMVPLFLLFTDRENTWWLSYYKFNNILEFLFMITPAYFKTTVAQHTYAHIFWSLNDSHIIWRCFVKTVTHIFITAVCATPGQVTTYKLTLGISNYAT